MARGGFSTRIDTTGGLEKPLAALARLRQLGQDVRPFMEDARTILVSSVLNRFRTGIGVGGIPWQPSRRALGLVKGKPGGKTLVDTADLQRSIRGEIGANYVEVGSDGLKNPVKALANQFGSRRQSVVLPHKRRITVAFGGPIAPRTVDVRAHGRVTNLPARPFIGIDEDDSREVREAWQDRLIRTFGSGATNA